jgi:hypothetical protein
VRKILESRCEFDLQNNRTVKLQIFIIGILLVVASCGEDEKAIETATDNREIGAYLRTTETINADFAVNVGEDIFSIELEAHDEQDGQLLEEVEVFLSFKPFQSQSSSEILLKVLESAIFEIGEFGKPRTTLNISFTEAAESLGLQIAQVNCKDQFEVRLNYKLIDGRSFTIGQSSSKIIAADDFWSSPFCYTINIIEPIPQDLFTGIYTIENLLDGPLGPTFGNTAIVEITKGHSTNTREMRLRHRLSIPQEQPRIFRFTVSCDQSVFSKNLLSSKIGFCDIDPAILLGPDTENGPLDMEDDTVFELWFVEGYLGFDGNCGFETAPSRLKFSKQ